MSSSLCPDCQFPMISRFLSVIYGYLRSLCFMLVQPGVCVDGYHQKHHSYLLEKRDQSLWLFFFISQSLWLLDVPMLLSWNLTFVCHWSLVLWIKSNIGVNLCKFCCSNETHLERVFFFLPSFSLVSFLLANWKIMYRSMETMQERNSPT